MQLAEQLPLDLILVASSLAGSKSEPEIIENLRERGGSAMICLHSDSATSPGRADVCIAKPLDAGKAIRLLASASARAAQF